MTITISAWALPAAITLLGWLPLIMIPSRDYDPTPAFFGFAWLLASFIAWLVYGFTALAS